MNPMRAALISELGSPPQVAELEDTDGIRVEAVALNPLDISIGRGMFYDGHPALPYAPGCEAAGRTGDGAPVYLFGGGYGVSRSGFLAERIAVPEELPLRIPPDIDPAVVAAAGIAGVAGWVSAAWKAKIAPGDRVLVLGARGAVGRVAVQAAQLLGADVVVGAGREARDGIVALDDVAEALLGDGFTVCIDPIWGEPLARVLAAAAPHARIVHLGQSAGPEAVLRSADVRGKELVIMGHSNFSMSNEERNRAYVELLDHVIAGRIVLEIERFPLDRVAEAWARQASGPGSKVVIEL